ncbi:MAG TPA: MoxR family ATPase, partial [Thiolinea sp.]|nr:MoxR family ATPase [Thiolinea sp.]
NRVERDETYSLPAAARDRFMLEVAVGIPATAELRQRLMFDPDFHDTDRLVAAIREPVLPFEALNAVAAAIQHHVHTSPALMDYAQRLWQATRDPVAAGVVLDNIDTERLLLSGASPRGMSLLIRAARVLAWLNGRDYLSPADIRDVFLPAIGHRLFFSPVYEQRREQIAPLLVQQILERVAP